MGNREKKKDSTLSVISCILAGVAFILPLPIILSFPLALAGAIVGLVDIGTKKKRIQAFRGMVWCYSRNH